MKYQLIIKISTSAVTLEISMENGAFQDSAAKRFNSLPTNIRNMTDYLTFCAHVISSKKPVPGCPNNLL